MKPHFALDRPGQWRCSTEGFSAIAPTVKAAYDLWRQMVHEYWLKQVGRRCTPQQ